MRRWLEITLLLASDIAGSVLAMQAALWFRQTATGEALVLPVHAFLAPALLLAAVWVGLLWYIGLYSDDWSRRSRFDELAWIVKAALFGAVVLFLITFDPAKPVTFTRMVLLSYGVTLVVVSGTGRMIVRGLQRRLFERGQGHRKALIVGTGDEATRLFSAIRRRVQLGYDIAGFVDSGTGAANPERTSGANALAPVVGRIDDLPAIIKDHGICDVMFGDPKLSHARVLDVVAGCHGLGVRFSMVPDLYDVVVGRGGVHQIRGLPLMPLFPNAMSIWQWRTKRLLDILVSATVLVAGAPIWLLVAAIIWLQDRHPVIYSQERVGLEGRTFRIHKFRSMVPDAEKKTGPVWAQKDDPRITPFGRIARKTRLDEIPQLWNVLKGEMSLVGPRPERPHFVEQLAEEIPLYRRRLHVKPGVTGWAQTIVEYDSSVEDVQERLKIDLYYIENMSLRFDVLVLLRTVWVMFALKGQ